jgi:transcriptional regulator with XRE-family HTH domain
VNVTDEQREQRNRLKAFIKRKGIDRQSFAQKLGYSKGYIEQVLSGNNVISEILEIKISKCYPELNIGWLMRGEGEMERMSTDVLVVAEPELKYGHGMPENGLINVLDQYRIRIQELQTERDRIDAEIKWCQQQERLITEIYNTITTEK